MTKNEIKQQNRERKKRFFTDALPVIERKYQCKRYEHFFKIKINNTILDYYPGGEMIKNTKTGDWLHIKNDDFIKRLTLLI